MKCLSILIVMFITVVPTRLSFGKTQSSTQTPQTTPNKAVPTAPEQHKKTTHKANGETGKDTKPGKPSGKAPTTSSQEAAYALSGHKGAPEGSPRPKQ